jgi:hypothetical protein
MSSDTRSNKPARTGGVAGMLGYLRRRRGAAIELGRVFEEAAAAHPGKSGVNYIRRDLPSGAERPGAREVDLGIDGGVGGGDGGSRRVLE